MERHLAPELDEALNGRWEPVYRSQLHYLVTWSTRGRRPVLKERHFRALQQLFSRRARSVASISSKLRPARITRMCCSGSPSQSIASAVRELKGRTGMSLLSQYPGAARVAARGNLVWDERYAVETVSAPRLEHVRGRLRSLRHGGQEDLAEAS